MGACIVNVFKYNQQDATLHDSIYYYKCSTGFKWFLRPSSGAQNCIHSTRYLSTFFSASNRLREWVWSRSKRNSYLNPVIHACVWIYRGVDKSLARPTSRCILFDGENISFDASLVMYINSTNIPPDHSSRGVVPTAARRCVWSRNLEQRGG